MKSKLDMILRNKTLGQACIVYLEKRERMDRDSKINICRVKLEFTLMRRERERKDGGR